jgi:4a-hydroxytetrahydrobiopterin dehydratase
MELLSDAEIEARLADRPAWRREGAAIVREDELRDFAAALAWVAEVGAVAQARDHHPDVRLHGWNKFELTVSSHSAGGLTAADFELAAELDARR